MWENKKEAYDFLHPPSKKSKPEGFAFIPFTIPV
jgi:hypothetical protein